MILYFADRQLNIIGLASTKLPKGFTVVDDKKTDEVETGVSVFECTILFTEDTRSKAEECTELGNHIILKDDDEDKLYTIIDAEIDTKNQEIYIYAEDDGMDLLNEIVGVYEADKAYNIAHYINMYAAGAGFVIGINEVSSLTRKLSWDGESTATARLASVATQFDGCEISFSFEIDGLNVTKKYINIYKERGKDIGVTLRLNKDIDRIITTKSIANLATALQCTGGTPEDTNLDDDVDPVPITLKGYSYDDGDFYVDSDGVLKSRKALQKWSRFLWKTDESALSGGHIVKQYSYDTTDQKTLCSHAATELKKICDMEVNYESDISKFPDSVKIGDRINIVDDHGELYLSTRVLKLEKSETKQEHKAIFGEHLIKSSGISQKVIELAAKFAKTAQSAARALALANKAKALADLAQSLADAAVADSEAAKQAVEAAKNAANSALESASDAQEKANAAQSAVGEVEESVSSLETTVNNAQQAADNAHQAANTAQQKADEAAQAAAQAVADAADAKAATEVAQSKAETAITKADEAKSTADTAKAEADTAKATADAAKLDAEKAAQDIDNLANNLEAVQTTMEADYARKTDLTEAEASLQSQISQNAAQIASTVSKVETIDETANNAQEQAEAAQNTADEAAQTAADARADATAAQNAADAATAAATAAQNKADTAKAAAETAQSVADKAEADLEAAKADLATVSSRVDATEEEIVAAQQAVEAAQTAADKAKTDAEAAATKAAQAQSTADTAVTNAANAKAAADDAAEKADLAQATADAAKGDAATAQARAEEAATAAANAQSTANTAVENAANAQAKANQAAADAASAQQAADDADARAAQAEADLATAQQNLANVTSRVDATEAEVEAAQAAVTTAQAAADKAKQEAEAAQATADTAKANAETAQEVADNAKTAADNAQKAADEAQKAADEAQAAVDALAVRVSKTETDIIQTSEQIKLLATKEEVTQTLGGYYTKEQTEAAISVKADEITSTVEEQFEGLQIGGRNLAIGTSEEWVDITVTTWSGQLKHTANDSTSFSHHYSDYGVNVGDWLTFSVVLNAINKPIAIRVDSHAEESTSSKHKYGNYVEIGQAGKSYVSVQVEEEYPYFYVYVGSDGSVAGNTIEKYKCFKVEKGNKATDWSPAPEDMASASDLEGYATKSEVEQTATSITSIVSETYATKKQVEDIQFGGRNLLLNSRFNGNVDGWVNGVNGNPIAEIDGVTCGHIEGAIDSTQWVRQDITDRIDTKDLTQDYVFSADIRVEDYVAGTTNPYLAPYFHGLYRYIDSRPVYTEGTIYGGTTKCAEYSGNGWVRLSWVVRFEFAPLTMDCYLYARDFAGDLYFKDLKLEKGNKATSWSPAPEDVDSGIGDALELANAAQETADANAVRVSSAESAIQQLADSIASLVRDGNGGSLIHQDSNGLWYFNIGDLEKNLSDTANEIDELSGIVLDANGNIDVLKSTAEALQKRTEYVRSYTDENGQPCLELGEGDSTFKVKITNTEIQFLDGTTIPAYVSNKKLMIEQAEVKDELQFGGFVWKARSNGNMGLIWKGVTE